MASSKIDVRFPLGVVLRDTITGFTGVNYAVTAYLNGCTQYLVKPKQLKDDGSPMDSHWIDDEQLELVKEPGAKTGKPSGGGEREHPPTR